MENVTHSLIGVVLGEGLTRLSPAMREARKQDPARAEHWRAGILWASVLGSNLPDFDFLMRPFLGGGNLGYLLHHRGYTHTLVLSLPLAVIAALVGRVAARRTRAPWGLLLAAGWVGVLCHIGADFWNDYGVHPFWPFDNHWVYGDFIFILEPLLWMALLPFAYWISHTRWARAVCALLAVALLAVCWAGHYMTPWVAAWVTLWGIFWGVGQRLSRRRVSVAFASIAVVLALFATASHLVRSRIRAALPEGETLLQLASSPAPANPLCWRVIVTTRRAHPSGSPPSDYVARAGVMALQPWGLGAGGGFAPGDPERCQPRLFDAGEALWAPVEAPGLKLSGMHWAGEFRGSLAEFERLESDHCRLRALMRFVRVPYWLASPQGRVMAGDLRYHSAHAMGFADGQSRAGEECVPFEPPWIPPSRFDYPPPAR